ncbi:hypothetical protein Q9L58_001054 [Maublancomyces gigas]|uniref:Uncharacterized protein n=1 Tax=Discina gigas TaxID=1032678 RepID=A0ABR3GVK0_9PEZI
MSLHASPPSANNLKPNQTPSPPRKLKRKPENTVDLPQKRLSIRKFNDYFRLSPMWEEPQYTPSACEDDLLADIGRYKPGSARPSALTPLPLASLAERDEWYDIGLLGDASRKVFEGEWTPMEAWLAHCDMYTRLWEPVNTDSHKAIDAVCDELEKGNYEWEEKEKGGDSPTHLATEQLNRSVVGQWPMENSIDSLKSVMRKIKSIASPEGSLVIGKDHEGRKWTSLLRL